MSEINSIKYRRILNSHVQFTNEFIIELDDGSIGAGGSPQGETISIYEDKKVSIDPPTILRKIEADNILHSPIDQEQFDAYLQRNIPVFGRNNAFGLSLAFYHATRTKNSLFEVFGKPETKLTAPRLCCNILNGGWHAYTNPVLSDFSEFILVAKSNDIEDVIRNHNEIQRVVKEKLLRNEKTIIGGNPVNRFHTADNRECIEFLLNIRDGLGLADQFDLMIDASGGDLLTDGKYRLSITDGSVLSSEEFVEYWMNLIRQYNLAFLEDPFHEKDYEAWHTITSMQQKSCTIIGDNFYSSDAGRIEEGAAKRYTHGVVIKPNQSGTITAVRRAIETAQLTGQIVVTSHRSISTESTFLSTLTCMYGVEYIKIGPLMTDYSSVIRLNEIIRLTEA